MNRPKLLKRETIFTQKQKDLMNDIYRYIYQKDYATKEDIMAKFNLNERTARDYISTISKFRFIITSSGRKGYKAAKTKNDFNDVFTALMEFISRNLENSERERQGIQFLLLHAEINDCATLRELREAIRQEEVTCKYLKEEIDRKIADKERFAYGTIFIPDVAKRTGNESDSAERVRLYREKQKVLQSNNDVTKCNTNKEIDIEINKDIEINNNTNLINEIVSYLNQKCKTNYKAKTNSTTKHIKARINEGFTLQDFKSVIDKKSAEWLGTDMEKYLRPETLFGNKFESYLNQNTPNNKSSPSDTSKIPKGVII